MRETSICGRVSISTVPPELDGGARWPSNKTSVRLVPKLRRFSVLLEKFWLPSPGRPIVCEPWKMGSLFNPSARLLGVVSRNCFADTMVSGVGEYPASEMTREPVTTMDSDGGA